MATLQVRSILFGNASGYVNPYFPPRQRYQYFEDQQFGNNPVDNSATKITFDSPLGSVSIRVLILDAPDFFTVDRNVSELSVATKNINATFRDDRGRIVATKNLYDTLRGSDLAAYFNSEQPDLQLESQDAIRASAPIKSVEITAPPNYVVVYFLNSGLVYVPKEETPQPTPLVTQPPIPGPARPDTPNQNSTTPITQTFNYSIGITINVNRVNIPLLDRILEEAEFEVNQIYNNFIDDERFCKLLLNFGSDYQKTIVNQKLSVEENKLLIKLINPLEDFVNEGQPVFISREVAKTVIDKIRIELPPLLNTNPYLRPRLKYDGCS